MNHRHSARVMLDHVRQKEPVKGSAFARREFVQLLLRQHPGHVMVMVGYDAQRRES